MSKLLQFTCFFKDGGLQTEVSVYKGYRQRSGEGSTDLLCLEQHGCVAVLDV